MANHKLATVSAVRDKETLRHPVHFEGIRLDEEHWNSGRAWVYVGNQAAVLGAGLARANWLPGTPECPNYTTFTIKVAERKFQVVKRSSREFNVIVDKTEDEQAAEEQRNKVEERRKRIETALPGLNVDAIPPDAATRLLACWGLLARAAVDIGVRCEGSTKLQRALEDVVQVRDTLGAFAGALADLRIDESQVVDKRLCNDREIRALVLQIGECGREGWDWARSHTGCKLKAQPGTPEPRAFGAEKETRGQDDDNDDDEEWPST